jgi:hypothetical protein
VTRVLTIEGKAPILVFAPHGFERDDERTDLIAEHCAGLVEGWAVVNRGWARADAVDPAHGRADCNDVDHCHAGALASEILAPLLGFRARILAEHPGMFMVVVHGMANRHRRKTADGRLDVVVGYGAGTPASPSCDAWRKDAFAHRLARAGLAVYAGRPGGRFSGWADSNMNQLFRRHYPDPRVQSLQVEVARSLRADPAAARRTAELLADAVVRAAAPRRWRRPAGFSVPEF